VKLGHQMRGADIAKAYPAQARHPRLFDPSQVDSWFVPELREALATWQETGDVASIELAAIPDLRLEAPGVVSFRCFTEEACDQILEEAKNYTASGLPQRAPNSMNNYGVVLNEVGMRPSFDQMLHRFTHGLGARFFGDEGTRAQEIGGVPIDNDNWGGSSLSEHHSFVVRYKPDEDRHLDMHVDECDVTFNFGLCDPDGFSGSDLAFCGMFGSQEHRRHLHSYAHVKGRCVLHSGKRRHGAMNIKTGERASLIMWTKSPSFRQTAEYQRKWGNYAQIQKEKGDPDRICLSYTHDRDFMRWSRQLGNAEGVSPPGM